MNKGKIMITCITTSGEALIKAKQSNEERLLIDRFVLANVPSQNNNSVDRAETLPAEHVVFEHEIIVDEVAYAGDDEVIYSMQLDKNIGNFTFNWIGLYSSEENTVVAIAHTEPVEKTAATRSIPQIEAMRSKYSSSAESAKS